MKESRAHETHETREKQGRERRRSLRRSRRRKTLAPASHVGPTLTSSAAIFEWAARLRAFACCRAELCSNFVWKSLRASAFLFRVERNRPQPRAGTEYRRDRACRAH